MKPNIKSFLAGAVVVILAWVIVSLAGGDDTTNDNELSSSEVAAEITAGGTATPAEDTSATADDTAVDDTAVDDTAADEAEDAAADDTLHDAPSANDEAPPTARFSGLPAIAPAELPIEAIDTLDLVASGGPFPYSQDDSVFQNREGILPDQPQGYYREYTVVTPGEGDRGARRIVAGTDGDLYYTDDHYDSFREIVLSS
ncbi:MAG: ribonuclease domain-containing protein [Acidimicrobiales bacterium]